jgi:hypothetical protein
MTDLTALFFIVLAWIVFVPWVILFISDNSSMVAFYHSSRLSSTFQFLSHVTTCRDSECALQPALETFSDKYIRILGANSKLSTFLVFSFYSIIITSSISDKSGIQQGIVLSFALTIIVLIMMRFLTNPATEFFEPSTLDKITITNDAERSKKIKRAINSHKERMCSFFFSFFAAAILISMIYVSYDVLSGSNGNISKLISITQVPDVWVSFMSYVILYIAMLLVLTFIGEIILFFLKPKVQYYWFVPWHQIASSNLNWNQPTLSASIIL